MPSHRALFTLLLAAFTLTACAHGAADGFDDSDSPPTPLLDLAPSPQVSAGSEDTGDEDPDDDPKPKSPAGGLTAGNSTSVEQRSPALARLHATQSAPSTASQTSRLPRGDSVSGAPSL